MHKAKNFLSFTLFFLAMACGFPSQAADEDWFQDGQPANGKIKYKNSRGWIKWSSEDLDPQASRPSPESPLWISDKYSIINGSRDSIDFTYNIVTPEGIKCCIGAKYRAGCPLEILYFPERWSSIDDRRYAQVLDLVLDKLSSSQLNFDFFTIAVDLDQAIFIPILEEVNREEQRIKKPSSLSLLEVYNRYVSRCGENSSDIQGGYFGFIPSMNGKPIRRRSSK